MTSAQTNDPLGYVDELRAALQSSYMRILFSPKRDIGESLHEAIAVQFGIQASLEQLGSAHDQMMIDSSWKASEILAEQVPETRTDSVAVSSSLGFCRLYGISLPPDIDKKVRSPLPVELIVPAIVEVLRMLEAVTDDARTLPARFDNSEPLEDRSHCTSILHSLMELWAIFNVLDDEYQRDLCERQTIDSDSHFDQWMRRLLDGFSVLDHELQRDEQIRLLSVATDLPLLENWRKMLAEPYRDPLPWWLDGSLEDIAAQTTAAIDTDVLLPSIRLDAQASPPCYTGAIYAMDDEFALAADDNPENRTVEYLSTHLVEILEHPNSDVWFDSDHSGALSRHTYDPVIAGQFSRPSGPHRVPRIINLQAPIEPDVGMFLNWLESQLALNRHAAQEVCRRRGWYW